MTDDKDQAFAAAEEAAHSGSTRMLELVLERLGSSTGARAVFGEPVEKDGRTIIPVAQSIIGTGAGSGSSDSDRMPAKVPAVVPCRDPSATSRSAPGARPSCRSSSRGRIPRWCWPYSVLGLVVLRTAVRLIRG